MPPAGILIGAIPLLSSSFSFVAGDQQFTAPVHLVTHNMNALKYYTRRDEFDSNQKSLQAWVAKNDFDIICLQEMVEGKQEPFLIPGYNKVSSSKMTRLGDHLGLFVFSRYPVVNSGKMEFAFNSYNWLMWVDLAIAKLTVRTFNGQLLSYDLRSYL